MKLSGTVEFKKFKNSFFQLSLRTLICLKFLHKLSNNIIKVNNIAPTEALKANEPQGSEKSVSKTSLLLGSLAALAISGVIYIAAKGKGAKKPGINIQGKENKPIEQIKEITVSAFKKAGNKFKKGKALTNTNQGYTGKLIQTDKNKNKFLLEYKDGFLEKSSKVNGAEKIYSYDSAGNLARVSVNDKSLFEVSFNDKRKIVKTSKSFFEIDTENGNLLRLKTEGKGVKNSKRI